MSSALLGDVLFLSAAVGGIIGLAVLPVLMRKFKSAAAPAAAPDSDDELLVEPIDAPDGEAAVAAAEEAAEAAAFEAGQAEAAAEKAEHAAEKAGDELDVRAAAVKTPKTLATGDTLSGGISPAIVYLQNLKLQIEHFEEEIHELRAQVSGFAQKHDEQFKDLLNRMGDMQQELHHELRETPAVEASRPAMKPAPEPAAKPAAVKPAPKPEPKPAAEPARKQAQARARAESAAPAGPAKTAEAAVKKTEPKPAPKLEINKPVDLKSGGESKPAAGIETTQPVDLKAAEPPKPAGGLKINKPVDLKPGGKKPAAAEPGIELGKPADLKPAANAPVKSNPIQEPQDAPAKPPTSGSPEDVASTLKLDPANEERDAPQDEKQEDVLKPESKGPVWPV